MDQVMETSSVGERRLETWIVVAGLSLGWILGLGGTLAGEGSAQQTMWAISSMGILTAGILLAVRNIQTNVLFAAGIALVVIGEGVIHAQGPTGLDAFASATYAYVPGLALVALSGWGPGWTRITAALSAVGFAVHAFSYLAGSDAGPTGPFAGLGYGMLSLTMIGWTWHLLRQR